MLSVATSQTRHPLDNPGVKSPAAGVSFRAYIHDRISQANRMPSLASVITERAKHLKLASSWDTP